MDECPNCNSKKIKILYWCEDCKRTFEVQKQEEE